jgi:hypothetical protein
MLKSMFALAAAGLLGTGAQLAQPTDARTVAIQDLNLVRESGTVSPVAHGGGFHGGGFHGGGRFHGGGFHGGHFHGHFHGGHRR